MVCLPHFPFTFSLWSTAISGPEWEYLRLNFNQRLFTPMNTVSLNPVLTPYPARFIPFKVEYTGLNSSFNANPEVALNGGSNEVTEKSTEGLSLGLRQTWADEAFMRQHIKAAGLRAPIHHEPATATRLRSLLRRAGVSGVESAESVGTSLAGFLTLNPRLPLWVALALVLEATGRFASKALTG